MSKSINVVENLLGQQTNAFEHDLQHQVSLMCSVLLLQELKLSVGPSVKKSWVASL